MIELSDFAEQAYIATSVESLFSELCKTANGFGFESVAFGPVRNGFGSKGNELGRSDRIKFPQEWVSHYFEEKCFAADPVMHHAFQLPTVQTWDELMLTFDCGPDQKAFMGQAREFGLVTGVTVPLRGAFGAFSICSFASENTTRPSFQTMCALSSLAQIMMVAEDRFVREANAQARNCMLTERQIQCLYWTAMGKSSWDISAILSISENTVNYHIKQAMHRLETSSRVTAAIKCSALGLFDTSH